LPENYAIQVSKRVAIIIGSTRPTRITAGIAGWIRDELAKESELDYELLDLAAINLPFLDETFMAALGRYEHEHTRRWSEIVRSFDGFVFVFPQYNWGYPAVLKNALDFLYDEWSNKPASFVTFGTRGGSRAAEQFATILMGLHMRSLDDHLEVVITEEHLDDDWQLKDIDVTLRPYAQQTQRINAEMSGALSEDQ
jgi:NAD(P)H-dependent FMN reductase